MSDETKSLIKRFAAALREHPITGEKFAKHGTVMTLLNVNGLGGLPPKRTGILIRTSKGSSSDWFLVIFYRFLSIPV
jgi:hypothetical protein